MRACNCPGIFRRVVDAFAERVAGWSRLGKHRPQDVAVRVPCERCHRVWVMWFGLDLAETQRRRLVPAR